MEPAGKSAGFSGKPTLQVGGVQDAVIAAVPGWGVVTVQGAPAAHPVAGLPGTNAAGAGESQVNGALGTTQPCTSTAVATMVSEVPLSTTKLVGPFCEPFTVNCMSMHCTGQVSTL